MTDENQFFSVKFYCDTSCYLVVVEVKDLTCWRKAERRNQDHRTIFQVAIDCRFIYLSHLSSPLEVSTISNAKRLGSDKVSANSTHSRTIHRWVRHSHREFRFDCQPCTSDRFLYTAHSVLISNTNILFEFTLNIRSCKTSINLSLGAMNKNNMYAQTFK